jgi:hypothetical protein
MAGHHALRVILERVTKPDLLGEIAVFARQH